MVRRLRVHGYKSLRNVDVPLGRLCVIFGPNASGKSNFIDALQLLSRIVNSRTVKEAFEPPYRGKPLESFAFDGGGVEALADRESARFSIEVDVEISPRIKHEVEREIAAMRHGQSGAAPAKKIHHDTMRYRVAVEVSPHTGMLRVAEEYLAPLGRDGKPRTRPMPYVETQENRIALRMEGQAHPLWHDRLLDHSIVSQPHYAPHYPHVAAFKRELQSWCFYYFEPRERMRALAAVKETRHIGAMGEDLASFLHTLRVMDERQFRAVEKAMHALIPSITAIRTDVNRIGEVELTLVEGKTGIPARVVSEGTLRVLGLLALKGVRQTPALIGFEEPENGVHPRRIRDIARILEGLADSADTQLLVTTHSPLLTDHVAEESLYVCRKDENGTSITPFQPGGDLFKQSNIDEALDDPPSARILRGEFGA